MVWALGPQAASHIELTMTKATTVFIGFSFFWKGARTLREAGWYADLSVGSSPVYQEGRIGVLLGG